MIRCVILLSVPMFVVKKPSRPQDHRLACVPSLISNCCSAQCKLIATRVEYDLLLDLRSLPNLIRLYRQILAEAQRRALLRGQSIMVPAVVVNHDDSGAYNSEEPHRRRRARTSIRRRGTIFRKKPSTCCCITPFTLRTGTVLTGT